MTENYIELTTSEIDHQELLEISRIDVKREADYVLGSVIDRQFQIKEQLNLLLENMEELQGLLAQQQDAIGAMRHTLGDNERMNRDTMHLIELSENLSVGDKLELFANLETALYNRRLGKDTLRVLGLQPPEVSNLYTGSCERITHFNPTSIPAYKSNQKVQAIVKTFLTQLNKGETYQVLQDLPGRRVYLLRARKETVQRQVTESFIKSRPKRHYKFRFVREAREERVSYERVQESRSREGEQSA